ncbi:MAG: hypothetical protein KJ667_01380 [Alphaproteobacteria bacterium]|nr:hypothetical protein [Alphaproteobacteria bacterium]
MPTFKGFEKNEVDQPVAVVDYPEATKNSFMSVGGAVKRVSVPNPHEARLDEPTFEARYGVNFEPLRSLPYNEGGYDLNQILAAQGPSAPQGPGMAPDPFKNGH